MYSDELRKYLSGKAGTLETLQWLQDKFLPIVVDFLNHRDSRKRLALYGGDRIPENERNLTDSRNRISLIIEYEFAKIITMILDDANIKDMFCAHVVANRFPDLEIRNDLGKLGLRFEIKCLQSVAEEKSANFSTLIKDIRPFTDFIVVFLWDWSSEKSGIQWDRSPRVLSVYAFDASSLAVLRDWCWLNTPPTNLEGGYQGFDILYAVNCSHGIFNEEEGNYGKLLRFRSDKFPYEPTGNGILLRTKFDYYSFKGDVVAKGFETLARQRLPELSENPIISEIEHEGQRVGFKSSIFGFLLNATIDTQQSRKSILKTIMKDHDLKEIWTFTEKYRWKHYKLSVSDDNSLSVRLPIETGDIEHIVEIGEGEKPKTITSRPED